MGFEPDILHKNKHEIYLGEETTLIIKTDGHTQYPVNLDITIHLGFDVYLIIILTIILLGYLGI